MQGTVKTLVRLVGLAMVLLSVGTVLLLAKPIPAPMRGLTLWEFLQQGYFPYMGYYVGLFQTGIMVPVFALGLWLVRGDGSGGGNGGDTGYCDGDCSSGLFDGLFGDGDSGGDSDGGSD